jgi:hypothetical protein
MNDGKAANWKEYYLDTLEDPNTGMPNFPNLVTFLVDVQKAFQATDRVKLTWTGKPHLTISTSLGTTGRCWNLG